MQRGRQFPQIREEMRMKGNLQTVTGMLALILQLGITMLVPILFCTLGGAWLGRRVGLMWLAVVGFVVGAIAGMQGAWQLVKRMTRDWPKDPTSEEELKKAERERADEGVATDE